jgi:hypothetical protein
MTSSNTNTPSFTYFNKTFNFICLTTDKPALYYNRDYLCYLQKHQVLLPMQINSLLYPLLAFF